MSKDEVKSVNEQPVTEDVPATQEEEKQPRSVSLADVAKQLLAKKKAMQAQQKGGFNGPQNTGNNITKEAPRKKQQNQRRRMGV